MAWEEEEKCNNYSCLYITKYLLTLLLIGKREKRINSVANIFSVNNYDKHPRTK